MNNNTLKRVIIVYLILIPVMWLLTEAVWGGLHGFFAGLRISKAFQDPKTSTEITTYMKQHGLSENASRADSKEWFEKLTIEEQDEFNRIIMKSVNTEKIAGFGSTFAVCVIVFGGIGLLSGALTKTWIYVGIFPTISFLLNNPVLRFGVIRDMPVSQKAIIVLISQFLACYIFAYIGASLSITMSKRRQNRKEGKP